MGPTRGSTYKKKFNDSSYKINVQGCSKHTSVTRVDSHSRVFSFQIPGRDRFLFGQKFLCIFLAIAL
jgi:hypothetical protein